jgi:DNA primase
MILEEGLNVKVVSFPEGHDPDSYAQEVGSSAFKTYIEEEKQDFILYKTAILLKDAGTDPLKRAALIREVVESIAKIPDSIIASVFLRECSSLMQMEERVLLTELNKIKQAKQKRVPFPQPSVPQPEEPLVESSVSRASTGDENQEKEIVRLLLAYGKEQVDWDSHTNTFIGPYVLANLGDVAFENPVCALFIEEYKKQLAMGTIPSDQEFIKHRDSALADLAISLISTPYSLSENWYAKRRIYVRTEAENLKGTILGGIFHLKKKKIDQLILAVRAEIQEENDPDNQAILMKKYMQVKDMEKLISQQLGSVIIK